MHLFDTGFINECVGRNCGSVCVCVMCASDGPHCERTPDDTNANIRLIEICCNCDLTALSCHLNRKMWFFSI